MVKDAGMAELAEEITFRCVESVDSLASDHQGTRMCKSELPKDFTSHTSHTLTQARIMDWLTGGPRPQVSTIGKSYILVPPHVFTNKHTNGSDTTPVRACLFKILMLSLFQTALCPWCGGPQYRTATTFVNESSGEK